MPRRCERVRAASKCGCSRNAYTRPWYRSSTWALPRHALSGLAACRWRDPRQDWARGKTACRSRSICHEPPKAEWSLARPAPSGQTIKPDDRQNGEVSILDLGIGSLLGNRRRVAGRYHVDRQLCGQRAVVRVGKHHGSGSLTPAGDQLSWLRHVLLPRGRFRSPRERLQKMIFQQTRNPEPFAETCSRRAPGVACCHQQAHGERTRPTGTPFDRWAGRTPCGHGQFGHSLGFRSSAS